MKATHLLVAIILLLGVSIEFSGCVDHLNPGVPPGSVATRLRVKTLTQVIPDRPNTSRVSSFSYDGQGRLTFILTVESPDKTVAPVETSTYQYDSQNHLSQLRREIVNPNSAFNSEETYQLSYNPSGQVSELRYQSSNLSGGTWSIKPAYNENNQITGTNKLFQTGGFTYTESNTYTYTGSNLTFATFVSKAEVKQSTFTASGDITYMFDTNKNPFYGAYIIPAPGNVANLPTASPYIYYTYSGGITNLLNLSPNNIVSSKGSNNAQSTYTYTYNADKLPTTRVTTDNNTVVETLSYEYETY